MQLPEFLQAQDNGFIAVSGHRIGLGSVVRLYKEGYSPEMIAAHFPTLPLALIHKLIAFYLENQADVDAYVQRDNTELDRQEGEASPTTPGVSELRRRLQSMRRAGG